MEHLVCASPTDRNSDMPGSPVEQAAAPRPAPPRTRSSRDLASRKLRSGTTIPDSADALQTLPAAPATSGPRRDREDSKSPLDASVTSQHARQLDNQLWRDAASQHGPSLAEPTEGRDMTDQTGVDADAAASRRARSASNLVSTSFEARDRRAASAHARSGPPKAAPNSSSRIGPPTPGVPLAPDAPCQSGGPSPMDIDAPVLPRLKVHPPLAPPTRTTGDAVDADMDLVEAGSPGDSAAAAVAVSPRPRQTRSAAAGDSAQRETRTGDGAVVSSGQPSGLDVSGASRPEPSMRVLPQRQGLHTPRASSAAASGHWGLEGKAALGGTNAAPGSPRRAFGPSSPRARSSGGPHSPRSPRAASASDRKTRAGAPRPCAPADAEAAKAAAELEAKAREEERKEEVLQRAREIRAARDAAARPLPTAPEPKRAKTHRDFLLEEMAWLAKEFQKERTWKLKQAKKYVRAVVRSNMDVESRAVVRQKEAELANCRRAAWIGKEVMQFWKKAERVVAYKQQSAVDARKKEAMDKHLSFLVGQTQKYSSLLAQRLAANEEDLPALLSPPPQQPRAAQAAVLQAPHPQASTPLAIEAPAATEEQLDAAEAALPTARSGELPVSATADAPAQKVPAAATIGAEEAGSAALGAPLADSSAAGEEDEEEFQAEIGTADDDDDEATLEEEEALAREAGEIDDRDGELSALNDEADMPLDQLLARYGFVTGNDAADAAQASPPPAAAATAEDEGGNKEAAQGGNAGPASPVMSEEHYSEVEISSEEEDVTGGEGRPTKRRRTTEAAKGLADMVEGKESEAAADGDYASEDSEADDEATLEEEDALAAQDGTNRAVEEAAEAAALADEADMPLEQLLARYGLVMGNGGAASDHREEDAMEVDGDGAEAAPSKDAEDPAQPLKVQDAAPPHSKDAVDTDMPMASSPPPAAARPPLDPSPDAAPPKQDPASSAAKEAAGPSAALSGPAAAVPETGKASEAAEGDKALTELEREAQGAERLEGVARLATEAQPKGHTLDSAGVHVKVPFLLKGSLREYQHVGLEWLITIYTRRLNGILADEMGLGKTIMTISLLAYLACEKGIWGPHLIVVPTSVMLNWEVECKKWCPAFKLLTYYGTAKERKAKRQGWSKPNAFHICITSYTLVLQDAKMFKRKKWKYLILDEAHMIKNWKSQRWQTLLNFNSQRRLLITGTPLQNDLMELWSLMHFLMPQVFASHAQFKDWFSNPLTGMVEGQEAVNKALVDRLHGVLRPFLLRRLKSEVEKQLPGKHEHIVRCRLSKRQRTLYEDYMASSDTASTLSSGNFLGIINVLMQLRKVCNHPDLFEGRPIVSAFDMLGPLSAQLPSAAVRASERSVWDSINLQDLNLLPVSHEAMSQWEAQEVQELKTPKRLIEELNTSEADQRGDQSGVSVSLAASVEGAPSQGLVHAVAASLRQLRQRRAEAASQRRMLMAFVNERRCERTPLFGHDMVEAVRVELPVHHVHVIKQQKRRHLDFADAVADAVHTCEMRAKQLDDLLRTFMFVIPRARAPPPEVWCSRPDPSTVSEAAARAAALQAEVFARSAPLRTAIVRQQLFFPDRRLIQFDCGKLQELAELLRRLKAGDHKALIFTQMARMLDILEVFLNLHGYSYLRLDGTTKPEQRQILMQRFNTNPKLFVFILSTRSGGVGMNLTGADTVIFYDSDWNPAMDAQAQDRCHRIGQTREVHIYRLVSERTIEENILTKSDQKRQLDHLAIQSGGFNTDYLQKFNPREILGLQGAPTAAAEPAGGGMSEEEVQAALRSVEDEGDRAAAAALERETADELAEFSAEPAPGPAPDAEADEDADENDDTRGAGASGAEDGAVAAAPSTAASQPSGELPLVKAEDADAEADVLMSDVAALALTGQSADPVANLESALRPIERYAVRFLEEVAPSKMDVEAAAAAVEAELDAQEWNMQEIERIQEEQEAEIEEDAEATRAVDWDKAAADKAYRAQVERAQERQRILMEQLVREEEAAAAAAKAAAVAAETRTADTGSRGAGAPSKKGGPKKRLSITRSLDAEEAESALPSPRPTFSRKRARTARGRVVVRPKWPGEDDTGGSSPELSERYYSSADEASHATWGGYDAGQKRARYGQQQQQELQQTGAAALPGVKVEGGSVGRPRSRFGDSPSAAPGLHGPFQRPHAGPSMPHPVARPAAPTPPQPSGPKPYNTARNYPTVGQLRPPPQSWTPWDVSEDVVLAAMVEEAVQEGVSRGDDAASTGGALMQKALLGRRLWELISTTLAAGAAALTVNAATAARQAYKVRSPEQCWERYQLLLAALRASRVNGHMPAHVPEPSGTRAPTPPLALALAVSGSEQPPPPTSTPHQPGSTPCNGQASGLPSSSPAAVPGQPEMPAQVPQAGPAASTMSPPPPINGTPGVAGAAQAEKASQVATAPVSAPASEVRGTEAPTASGVPTTGVPVAAHTTPPADFGVCLAALRQQLVWLARRNPACSTPGLQAVLAAAYVEFPPTNGTAAAAQELARELQALLAASGAAANSVPAPKPAVPFKAPPGAPQPQPLPLSVGAADAAAVKEAVRRAAGPCSRGILRHLSSVVAAVKVGGIKAGNAALTQLLQLPKAPPAQPQQQLVQPSSLPAAAGASAAMAPPMRPVAGVPRPMQPPQMPPMGMPRPMGPLPAPHMGGMLPPATQGAYPGQFRPQAASMGPPMSRPLQRPPMSHARPQQMPGAPQQQLRPHNPLQSPQQQPQPYSAQQALQQGVSMAPLVRPVAAARPGAAPHFTTPQMQSALVAQLQQIAAGQVTLQAGMQQAQPPGLAPLNVEALQRLAGMQPTVPGQVPPGLAILQSLLAQANGGAPPLRPGAAFLPVVQHPQQPSALAEALRMGLSSQPLPASVGAAPMSASAAVQMQQLPQSQPAGAVMSHPPHAQQQQQQPGVLPKSQTDGHTAPTRASET